MPGQRTPNSFPKYDLRSRASWGLQTTPEQRASRASAARRITFSSGAARKPEFAEIFGCDAREERYRVDLRRLDPEFGRALSRAVHGGLQHVVAADPMHRDDADARPHERPHAGFDRTRNIVQFRIEKDVGSERFELRADRIAVTVQRFVSDLEPHAERREFVDEGGGDGAVLEIERHDQLGLRSDGHHTPAFRRARAASSGSVSSTVSAENSLLAGKLMMQEANAINRQTFAGMQGMDNSVNNFDHGVLRGQTPIYAQGMQQPVFWVGN